MGVRKIEFDENGSDEEAREVLTAIKVAIEELEKKADGTPGWKYFGEKGGFFFTLPRRGWNENQLMEKVDFTHEVSLTSL